jgi:hypothetical protein
MEIKHQIRSSIETCPCKGCKALLKERERKQQVAYEEHARENFGPNWKNILSGMGDQ